jgi:hypothetical protein
MGELLVCQSCVIWYFPTSRRMVMFSFSFRSSKIKCQKSSTSDTVSRTRGLEYTPSVVTNTGCPTRYQTRHFFNNSNTNEDIATKFEQEYVFFHVSYTMREVRFKFRCNILISVKIIKEMPGSVVSGTPIVLPIYLCKHFVIRRRSRTKC